MSRSTRQDSSSDLGRLHDEAERARTDLVETVDALAAKADVKGRAQGKAEETRAQAQQMAGEFSAQARDNAGHAREVVRANPVTAAVAISAVAVALSVRRYRTRCRGPGDQR